MEGTIGDGEKGTISRNVALFTVYQRLANLDKFSSNNYEDSTVVTTRFNRTDMYEGVTLVMIVEKIDSLSEAVNDVHRKARWLPHYARLPFIFGIAVTPDQLEIYTFHENNSMRKAFSADLRDVVERWRCVVAAINIARTLKMFVEQHWVIKSLRFDRWHLRNNKKIRLDVNFVEVEFQDRMQYDRMSAFYTNTSAVPHLEHLCRHPLYGSFTDDKKRVRLIPVGVECQPESVSLLVAAVKDICEGLFSLHNLGYEHCEVRWSNIINVCDSWFLIDCEYACRLDEHELLALRSGTIIKQRFVLDTSRPWCPLFDVYQVGLLLQDCTFTSSDSKLMVLRDYILSKRFDIANVQELVAEL